MGLIKKYYDDKWSNFIFVMEEIGDWKHAEQLKIEVLDMRKKLLGEEHLDTLFIMGYLVSTYSSQGRWDEAEQLEVHVLDMRKKLIGAEHPDILLSMANLARIYANKGNLEEAEQLEVQHQEKGNFLSTSFCSFFSFQKLKAYLETSFY